MVKKLASWAERKIHIAIYMIVGSSVYFAITGFFI